jgi:tetratricopeptide (TPR) repeat protein
MKFRNLVVAAAGACLLALTSFAQITAIEGDVKGVDGTPSVNTAIKIVRIDIKGNYPCKTNKKGHFFYNGLPPGTYNVSVEIDGKEMDIVRGVRTRLGDPTPVNFDLQKVAQANAALNKQAAAAGASGAGLTKEQERSMNKEDREKFEKVAKEREAQMKKNKELNDAYTAGTAALECANDPACLKLRITSSQQGSTTEVTVQMIDTSRVAEYEKAIASLTKASELDPKQLAVWQHLAQAYVDSASKKTGPDFDAGIAKGIENYGKALELSPSDAGTHSNLAIALGKAKKFPEATAETEKAAQLDPTKAGQFYYNLGASLVNAGQSEPASAAFKKAIEIDPKHADSYYQTGVYLIGKASFAADGKVTPVAGTVEAFQKYLELAPTGQFADSAKAMLESLNAKVDTAYKNPNAPAPKKKK